MTQEEKDLLLKDLCAINSDRWMSLEDLPNEEWKTIEGYEDRYSVSNYGRVKTKSITYYIHGHAKTSVPHILKIIIRKDGYCKVNLGRSGEQKTLNLHRLVAMYFIPNPNNLPCVNHKDENPSNNIVDNLEWCSYEYNNNYGSFKEKHSKAFKNYPKFSKPVIQMTLDGEFIQEYPSIAEAARQLNGNYVNISEYLNEPNKRNHAYGYKWKYKEDTN